MGTIATTGDDSLRAGFEAFLLKRYGSVLEGVLLQQDDCSPPNVHVDALYLSAAMPRLVNALLTRPRSILPLLEEAAVSAQDRIFHSSRFQASDARVDGAGGAAGGSVKRTVKVRVEFHRLSCPGISPAVSQVRKRHVGRLLSLSGTVLRASAVKSHEVEQLMECTKCKHRFLIAASKEGGTNQYLPSVCPSSHAELNSARKPVAPCENATFRAVSAGRPIVCDYQELRIQEPMVRTRTSVGATWPLSSLGVGGEKSTAQENHSGSMATSAAAPPRTLLVVVEEDLVDVCKPGDDVCVTLTVLWRWHRANRDQRAELELVGHATAVHVLNKRTSSLGPVDEADATSFAAFWRAYDGNARASDPSRDLPLHGRDMIIQSVCPQLCGMQTAKLAVLLALIGGVPRMEPKSGTSIRGESHLLIVGDPGMGKSQLLRYAAQIAPRAVMTTGTGSTAAGLTAAAVKADGGEGWSLEAGALVLADGGVCCVDEFDTISVNEQAAMHEAMEQQTISIAKGGIVATLQTRCAVLGATNPKGMKFDPTATLAANTGLAPPLLSRFDCVLVVLDEKDPDKDHEMSSHMISSHCGDRTGDEFTPAAFKEGSTQQMAARRDSGFGGGALSKLETACCSAKSDGGASDGLPRDCGSNVARGATDLWPFERVRRYIALVRCAFDPILTPDAESLIRGYYQMRRRGEDNSSGRPTIRLLESLIRLAQAHARLMWRTEAIRRDVLVAVELVEASSGVLRDRNAKENDDPESLLQQRELQLIRRITAELGTAWF